MMFLEDPVTAAPTTATSTTPAATITTLSTTAEVLTTTTNPTTPLTTKPTSTNTKATTTTSTAYTTTTMTPTTSTTTTTTVTPTTTSTTTTTTKQAITTTTTITTTPTTTTATTTITTTTTTNSPTTTRLITTTTAAGPVAVSYIYHHYAKSWTDARAICIQNGGDMASMDTQERFDAVKAFLEKRKASGSGLANTVWVGINRNGAKGKLYWTNGAPMDESDIWASGYPQSGHGCGYTSPFKGMTYRTYLCSYQARFLCQTPA
ncbi:uncharacterized protein [Haliotis asinina]|uniref:uncharacterized protein n=1 Tax=Haliotis asinina TaxID=109174 RepID=UPI003531F587